MLAAVVAAAAGAVALAVGSSAFAAPPSSSQPRGPAFGGASPRQAAGRGSRAGRAGATKASSALSALQLGEAPSPAARDAESAQSQEWATCIVEAQEAGRVGLDGTLTPGRSVLEEWVVGGERARLRKFRAWRQSVSEGADVRCEIRTSASSESAVCLECVSHPGTGDEVPFSPRGLLSETDTGFVMTFSGLDRCHALTAGAGFCKIGTVAMVM